MAIGWSSAGGLEPIGVEPTTYWLQTSRSPTELRPRRRERKTDNRRPPAGRGRVAIPGSPRATGPTRTRTWDLIVISDALYQLSYEPLVRPAQI
jgi:hypothetical protein